MGREERGGGDRQSSQRRSAERLKFVGGEGGEGRGESDRQSRQRRSAERLKFVGGEGLTGRRSGGEREVGEVDQQSSQRRSAERLKFTSRWGGRGGETMEGGQSMVNLERICEDFGRITSDNVDPGGRSIDSQLGKDLQRLWKDYL